MEAVGGTAAKYSNDRTVERVRVHPDASGPAVNEATNGYCAEFGTKRSHVQILSPTS
jgi:hypothetical protein